MTEARDGMAAAVLNGKFYAIAGRTNNSVEIYDPQTEQWSLGPALPVPLYSAAAITINEKILVIGGYNSGNLNSVYEYEFATNQWTQKASMPTARYGHKLAFANGKVWRSEEVLQKLLKFMMLLMIHGPLAHLFQKQISHDCLECKWYNLCRRGI